jgi:hypothetical protein
LVDSHTLYVVFIALDSGNELAAYVERVESRWKQRCCTPVPIGRKDGPAHLRVGAWVDAGAQAPFDIVIGGTVLPDPDIPRFSGEELRKGRKG